MKQKTSKGDSLPPSFWDNFLEWYCHEDLLEEVQGDLYEAFRKNLRQRNVRYAKLLFAYHVILFFRPDSFKKINLLTSHIMWHNYVKMGIRNLYKHTGFAFLNVFGLTIGLATCFLIMMWIQDEMSYNKYHEYGDQIYRVKRNMFHNGGVETTSATPWPVGEFLEENYPEVIQAEALSWNLDNVINYEDKVFRATGNYVGEGFFSLFTHPFLAMEKENPLSDPGNIAISKSLADKLFGHQWQEKNLALGEMLQIHLDMNIDLDSPFVFKVAAVFEDVPQNSTWQFDFLLSERVYNRYSSWVDNWGNGGYNMFVRLQAGTSLETFNERIKNIVRDNDPNEDVEIFLQPYEEIYLYAQFENGEQAGGRIVYIKALSIVALFIFLIACINFMNLATARASIRAKEIGIRKTIGAFKRQIRSQFLVEACLLALFSFLLACGLLTLVLPYFNQMTDKSLSLPWMDPSFWAIAIGITLLMGVLAGSYPAFVLSSFNINSVLKGVFVPQTNSISLRKGLVIFQFVMSNVLIIATIAVYQQIQFIQQKNLGFDRDQVVQISIEGNHIQKHESFKEKVSQHPGVLHFAVGGESPTRIGRSTGGLKWEGKDPDFKAEVSVISADYDYVQTLGMEILKGRGHDRSFALDSAHILVNEAAAKLMEMEDPIGEDVSLWGREGKIIGMIKDFHFSSMYTPIQPLLIRLDPQDTWTFFIKLSGDQTLETLAFIEEAYQESNPGFPFEYEFLDDSFESTFRSEVILGKLAGIFSFLAIVISCLGLLGLAAFASERRIKEMGIRKIFGASVSQLLLLLNKDFLLLVAGAFFLAIPVAWWIISRWYQDFAYHSELSWQVFALGGLFSLLIAIGTTCFQSLKVASRQPAQLTK